ncbi:hypothetical protein COLO4_02208 [Corchorus olitorius]|uniref:Uncharacterized protein n=1 Tax=Corchorus olitorius TaxID=93759 RepID=A0A1R3L1H3_9ROSI|nr:hypothetical protein COLO4_02208 [Corchorus olitorius]
MVPVSLIFLSVPVSSSAWAALPNVPTATPTAATTVASLARFMKVSF